MIKRIIAILLCLVVGCGKPGGTVRNDSDYEEVIILLVNQEREKHNLRPLNRDDQLMDAARDHAYNMASHEQLSHSLGSDPGTRMRKAGYNWMWCGENIAWNQSTPEEVMAAWMDSPGHRRNILSDKAVDIGVGVMYSGSNEPYYCQTFGKKSNLKKK